MKVKIILHIPKDVVSAAKKVGMSKKEIKEKFALQVNGLIDWNDDDLCENMEAEINNYLEENG